MHLEFTDEQRLLADAAQRFCADHHDLPRRRQRCATPPGFDRQLWSTMAELGWLALRLPERLGGFGGGAVESAILMQALGHALAVEPYLHTGIIGATALALGASEDAALATAIAEGSAHVALAVAERRSRYALERVTTRATVVGDGYVLTGHKTVVAFGASATHLLVSARSDGAEADADGISLFLLDAATQGVGRRDYPTIDGLRAAEVELCDVAVPAEALLGEVGAGHALLRAVVDEALIGLCAEALGAMDHMLEATRLYALERRQFGRPIADFQVIQHRLVDMYVALELARSVTLLAAAGLASATPAERTRLAATAKHKTGEAIKLLGEAAIQIHGGMGMTDEMAISHYFKRITIIDTTLGDAEHHLRRLSTMLHA